MTDKRLIRQVTEYGMYRRIPRLTYIDLIDRVMPEGTVKNRTIAMFI